MDAPPVPERGMCSLLHPPLPVHVLHHVNHRKLVENNRASILRGFKFRTVKQLLASQPDPVVVDKEQKRAAATVPSDSNSIGKEYKTSRNTRNWLNYGTPCRSEVQRGLEQSGLWPPNLWQNVQQLRYLSRRTFRHWVVLNIYCDFLCMCIFIHTDISTPMTGFWCHKLGCTLLMTTTLCNISILTVLST